MATWTISKKLNVSPYAAPLVIQIKQYTSDFALKLQLYSTVGDLDIPAGATTKIRGTKRDGNGYELTGTRIGHTCTFSGTKEQMQQMTAAHGRGVFEVVVEHNGKELITANFYLEVQRAAMDAGTVTSESIIEEFADFQSKITAATAAATAAEAQADRAEAAAESIDFGLDVTPTQGSTNAVSSGGVYGEISTISDEIDDVNSALSVLQDTVANIDGVPTAVRNAICVLCKKAVYTETGLLDELAVIESWASDITAITLNHTEAALNAETLQLIAVTVPEGGTITWQSNNTSVATVSSSGLVTPVSNGSVNIIAISGNAIATCSITVTGMKSLTGITATYTQSRTVYYTDSLAVLNSDLVVVATYDDSTSRTLLSNEYVLSGTLVEGTSTVTVTYGGYTATFSVAVTGNYTQYTKIIATGAQYIKTGLSETDLDGCSFEYKVNPTHSGASSGHLFSANNNFVAFPQVRGASALNHLIFAKLKGTERTSADNVWTEGTDITVVAYADSNNSVSMNGTTVIESVPAGSTTPSASNYYTMFAYGGSTGQTYRFKGALYYFKIYNSDGTLIHHYVPVVENSTGIAGVRDLITDTFHSSATSTAFTVE